VVDLSQLPEAEQRLTEVMTEQARRPFNLRRGPLLRVILFRLKKDEHVVLLTMHHIISDAWSLAVFTGELAALYRVFSEGRPSRLPELPIQYADFAAWQGEWLRGEVLKTQLAYWKQQLGGPLPALSLPTDYPRPATQSFRGASQSFKLPQDLSDSLRTFSRRENVTLFMTLLAAFQLLLYRSSGQQEVVVGTDVANRNSPETEGLIGFFVNSLVLRTRLSGSLTFRELLARVRKVTLEAYAHQDVPFHQLVRELQPKRDLSRNPLFQVMFILQNTPPPTLELRDLESEPLEIPHDSAPFDLTISLTEDSDGGLTGTARYSTDIFEASTITRLLKNFSRLLHTITAGSGARLDEFEILPAGGGERRSIESGPRHLRRFEMLAATRPKIISLSSENLVRVGSGQGDMAFPLIMEPAAAVHLVAWATNNRGLIEERLLKHGALLFRNFGLESLDQFESFARATSRRLIDYGERSSPRTLLQGHVYTSTDYPADQHIRLHNEQSYTLDWPMKIWFCCFRPASEGGRTLIADSRKIFRRLEPKIVARFLQRQIMYVRHYGDGLGLRLQEVFQTDEKAVIEEYCRKASIELEWQDHSRLRTRQIRPAVRRHPRTGEAVWFNHALFFHMMSLEPAAREALLRAVGEEDLPYNTFYGDGSSIEPWVLESVREAYRQETVSFPWQRGDILMLDNMLTAHGREPFTGQRRVAAVMGDPFSEYMA
jgi:alpha-ketoglutarate-dependent taurine dioxygenase